MKLDPKDIKPAFCWVCPNCKEVNFEQNEICLDLSEDELRHREEMSQRDGIQYEVYEVPSHVHCRNCWTKYEMPKYTDE